MAESLAGKHYLITGASKGLGRSLAKALHQQGATLSLTARNLAQLEELKRELGGKTTVYGADLGDSSSITAMLNYFRAESGSFDGLINNAGLGWYKPADEYTFQESEQVMNVNFNSLVHVTQAVIPDLKQKRNGQILNIASDLARRPLANFALYTAAKHAVAGYSQSLTRELKSFNIRVMVMTPGLIDTGFGGRNPGDIKPPVALNPDDLADIAVFMLTRPTYVLMDEVSVHPASQDF